jgi:NAD(P)-dependent dehydrogenase (short-subunit alcohol dehydrogenase family)
VNVAVVGGAGAIGRAIVLELEAHSTGLVWSFDLPETSPDVDLDVRDELLVEDMFHGLEIKLDALVYAAGVQVAAPIQALKPAQWDDLFAVNVRGAYLAIQAMLDHYITRSIVLVASIAGLREGGPGLAAYSASKGALVSLGRALAVELAPATRVNIVCPGWTDTSFNMPTIELMGGVSAQAELIQSTVPLKRQATPEEIAPAVRFALEATYMTGAVVVVDGGVTLH